MLADGASLLEERLQPRRGNIYHLEPKLWLPLPYMLMRNVKNLSHIHHF
jgi:hypothetical protein